MEDFLTVAIFHMVNKERGKMRRRWKKQTRKESQRSEKIISSGGIGHRRRIGGPAAGTGEYRYGPFLGSQTKIFKLTVL